MDILSNAPAQYGALGLLIVAQAFAIIALWRQLAVERKQRDEDRRQCHKELLELNGRLISSQGELQLLLKGLVNGMEMEKLFKEYSSKD
jgi:hypothetical protein